MRESRRWRVILRGKVVATYAHAADAMARARVLADQHGTPVEVHHRPAGYQAPYRTVVRPNLMRAMAADRYAGSSEPDVLMEAQGG